MVDILSYPRQTFYSDSSISYNSLQHNRSRSKKLKTPEDKRLSAVATDAEIIATEATADDFKVNEKQEEKVRRLSAGVPSGEEENSGRMQLDQVLLDNAKGAGEIRTDGFSHLSCTLLIL